MCKNQFDSFVAKQKKLLINDITEIIPMAEGMDSIFEESVDQSNNVRGFRTQKKSDLRILMRLGPQEAVQQTVVFDFEERYDVSTKEKVFYRYEVSWRVNVPFSNTSKFGPDYIDEAMLDLRRSIRFDHHPKQNERTYHPPFHWHPNGCSEVRLPTSEIKPIHVLTFARIMFDPPFLSEVNKNARLKNIADEIGAKISKLPIP